MVVEWKGILGIPMIGNLDMRGKAQVINLQPLYVLLSEC